MTHPVINFLTGQPAPLSVKAIAEGSGVSESRVREILAAQDEGVLIATKEGRSTLFALAGNTPETAQGSPEDAANRDQGEMTPETEVGADTASTGPGDPCPFCGSAAHQAAGEEGTFLGGIETCNDCGKSWNRATGREATTMKAAGGRKAPLNPQYKINAKVQAMEAAGGKLSYDKASKEWLVTKPSGQLIRMSAVEFSKETPETIIEG